MNSGTPSLRATIFVQHLGRQRLALSDLADQFGAQALWQAVQGDGRTCGHPAREASTAAGA